MNEAEKFVFDLFKEQYCDKFKEIIDGWETGKTDIGDAERLRNGSLIFKKEIRFKNLPEPFQKDFNYDPKYENANIWVSPPCGNSIGFFVRYPYCDGNRGTESKNIFIIDSIKLIEKKELV